MSKYRPQGTQEYKGNGNHDWEHVVDFCAFSNDGPPDSTYRLRVPGGWLYRIVDDEGTTGCVFVPVPNIVGYQI